MEYKLTISLLFFVLTGSLHSQTTTAMLDEFPDVFAELKKQLIEEDVDSVLTLTTAILDQQIPGKVEGIAWFHKGQTETLLNRNSFASHSFQEAINIFKRLDFEKGLALAYARKADVYFLQKDFYKANEFYNLSINFAKAQKLPKTLAGNYEKKGIIYTRWQRPDTAVSYLKTALQFAASDINILNQIATNYHADGKLDSAIFYFRKGLLLKEKNKDAAGLISDYTALGNLYKERGSFELAQQSLLKALKVSEAEKDTFSMTTVYTEIGDIYAAQKVWHTAEQHYQKALDLARIKNSRFAEAACLKKLGHIYLLQKKKALAAGQLEVALKIYEQLKNKTNTADVLIELSKIYTDGHQFEKAKHLLQEAIAYRKNSPDKLSTLSAKMALAEIEITHGNPSKGIQLAEACLLECKAMKDRMGLRKGYLLLSDAYAKNSDFEKAFKYYRWYTVANDSLTSIERMKVVNELELRYSTAEKDKEIAEQNIKIEKQKLEIQERNNQLLMLFGSLILIALLSAFLFFINKKNKQLNEQNIRVLKKEQEAKRLTAVIEGEEKERKRIARELHDGLGAVLATVKMKISNIKHKQAQSPDLQDYEKAEQLIDNACRTVREISHDLMPHILEQQGLEFAIRDLCQTLQNNNVIQFDFIYFGNEMLLNDDLKITTLRITQELLKNVIKHAAAKEVIVQLTIEEDALILIVEDDGKGFDISTPQKGIGLENIRARTAYLNGTLDIDSQMGQGTTFTIQLPLIIKK